MLNETIRRSKSKYANHKLRISIVKNIKDKNPVVHKLTWQQLLHDFKHPEVRGKLNLKDYLKADKSTRDDQKDGKAIIGGTFIKPNTRQKVDLNSISIVPLDFDDGHFTFDNLVNSFKKLKFECFVYTTYSHGRSCGKFRVIVLLDKVVKNNFESFLCESINYFESKLGPHIDQACRKPSQLFFTPSCPPGAEKYFRSEHICGKPLCTSDFNVTLPARENLDNSVVPGSEGYCRPGDDYSNRATYQDVLCLMKQAGWKEHFSKGEFAHLTRPGKLKGISATWGFHDTKFLYIHSSDSKVRPFEHGKSYTAFAIYALLKHDGDFSAAARQLSKEGYGKHNSIEASPQEFAIDAPPTEWPELHDDALPGWIGKFIRLACHHSEAHEAAILVTLILRLAAEFLGPHVMVGDSKQRARTNAVIVGNSSKSRKGTSAKPVERLFLGLENSAQCTPGPLSSGEGLIFAVRDKMQEFDKKSGEYIVVDPGITDKRLFVVEEEFAAALTCTKREGNTLSAIIRGLFDDGNAEPLTKTNKIKTTGAHVVILAHITSVELKSLLNNVQLANGFANRFLWVHARRKKLIAMPQPMPDNEVAQFQKIIVRRIEAADKLQVVKLSKKALKLWEAEYPRLTMDYTGAAGSVVNRSEVHVVRLALIYALAAGHSEIKEVDLRAALALVKYSQESAFLIFKGCQGDKRKEKLLQALRDAPNNKMTLSEINSIVFSRNVKSEEISKLLNELESSKLLTIKSVKTTGAPKKYILLAPVNHV